ncbi:hypothetical protein C463_12827 [Halorubrum californiense DSM 19288]|uniref:Uncharacterized protein n=1 Tax=Halorubrum californiense DSM 19288 TaxID=1227465 RepID=M0E198_9EURY|nr:MULTISPECIES: hypothetical protein [Halorubrum]ELZ41565.1 hypothetical protein C463_12827 [Halorubrum californiense DSM 19288]TKX65622.1 hypothetical protein EXE40_16730 [Halorubrum sp. GN11GM_10-3_MGM]
MTQKESRLTRREALAGAGAIGFAAVGAASGRQTGTDNWDEYTDYTYAQTDTPFNLLVGWRRTENGTAVDSSPVGAIDDVDAAGIRLVDIENALPHDRGTASVGLRLEDPEDTARVWLRVDPDLDGLDPASAALAERVTLTVRQDTGIFGIGSCGGAEGEFASAGELITDETLADIDGSALADGVELRPGLLGDGCLGPGEQRCLTFAWEFDGEGGNAGQGGAVDFDVEFIADECDAEGNPFEMDDGSDASGSTDADGGAA